MRIQGNAIDIRKDKAWMRGGSHRQGHLLRAWVLGDEPRPHYVIPGGRGLGLLFPPYRG